MLVSIIVLNWNGKHLLEESLPPLDRACATSGPQVDVIVVDNGSTDESVSFVRKNYPHFSIIALPSNLGFGEGNNRGAAAAKGEILVFLNNDMTVEPDFLRPLVEPFAKKTDLFAVTAQIFFQDKGKRREETGKTLACWESGAVRFRHEEISRIDEERSVVPVSWAGGGSSAFSREKFLQLGGFRAIYAPAYVEDADLSYQAWKRGWQVLFTPLSRVHHKHRSTSSKVFSPEDLERLVHRNQTVFVWANLTDPRLLALHLMALPVRFLWSFFTDRGKAFRRGIIAALPHFFRARGLSRQAAHLQVRSDQDLLRAQSWRRDALLGMKKLEVLFVCPYIPRLGYHAGAARMYHIVKGLSTCHHVGLLSFVEDDAERAHVADLEKFCSKVRVVRRQRSAAVADWFHIKPRERLREFADPRMKQMIVEEVGSRTYDLVQFEYLEMGYLVRHVKKYGVVSLLTHHEVQHRSIKQALSVGGISFLDRLQYWYEWMRMLNFELSVARQFDHIITMTEPDRQSLTDYDRSLPISVLQTGVDAEYFSRAKGIVALPRSIVFVGYFKHHPNVDAMLYFCSSIFPKIRQRYPEATLRIVGADPPAQIRNLATDRSIVVTGRVEDIRTHIGAAEVFVVPVRLGAGIRGKILEAWSMKKPVVSTSLGCSGLDADHGRNILIANGEEEFAKTVMKLFESSSLRDQLGAAGFETARSLYDWPNQVRKHEELYKSILKEVRS